MTNTPTPRERLGGSIVWFALGMIFAGVGGTLAFLAFIDGRIDDRILDASNNGKIPNFTLIDDRVNELIVEALNNGTIPRVSTSLSDVPSGAILAFADARYSDQNKGDPIAEGCPAGWIRFKEAEGRFILGANARSQNEGPNKYWVSRQAGRSAVILLAQNLPDHFHKIDIGKEQTMKFVNWDKFDGGGGNSPLVSNNGRRHPYSAGGEYTTKSNPAHRSAPIEIMPPYIALYYCKKQ